MVGESLPISLFLSVVAWVRNQKVNFVFVLLSFSYQQCLGGMVKYAESDLQLTQII